jgi:integrase
MASITLTQRSLISLKTDLNSEFFWDRDFRDGAFGVRVYASGKKVFVYDYRNQGGRQRRVTLGDVTRLSLADARARAREIYTEARRGKDESLERKRHRECPTLASLIHEFKPIWFPNLAPKTVYDTERRINNYILPAFGEYKITDISRDDVYRFLSEIACKRGARVQADRVKEILRKILNHALERGLIETNPATKIQSFQTKQQKEGRSVHLSEPQLVLLWAATEPEPQPIRSLFRLIFLTGQRSGEVCRARWTDICFETNRWEFQRTKSGNIQVVPLSPLIIAELEDLKMANEEARARSRLPDPSHYSKYLFPSPRSTRKGEPHISSIAKACDRIETRMGIKFTPHDLRRTAATTMRGLSVSSDIVKKVLNHREKGSQMKCLARYDRYDELPEMQEAYDKLSNKMCELLNRNDDEGES